MCKNQVKGFKVFKHDWTCSPNDYVIKQYACPGKFEEVVIPTVGHQGMHFCKKAVDCFNYYRFTSENKIAEVIAYGDIDERGDISCTNKLEVVREIPWEELLAIVNFGEHCTGFRNSGNWNSGNCNSGNWNSGNRNSGNWNSGDCNSGDCNSGDWNKANFSNGCFNTISSKINLFNKPSNLTYQEWRNSKARMILQKIPHTFEWVCFNDMTDEEKAAYPNAKAINGYLKRNNSFECATAWWSSLNDEEKKVIMSIPNFDKAIFREITGIDVDG